MPVAFRHVNLSILRESFNFKRRHRRRHDVGTETSRTRFRDESFALSRFGYVKHFLGVKSLYDNTVWQKTFFRPQVRQSNSYRFFVAESKSANETVLDHVTFLRKLDLKVQKMIFLGFWAKKAKKCDMAILQTDLFSMKKFIKNTYCVGCFVLKV